VEHLGYTTFFLGEPFTQHATGINGKHGPLTLHKLSSTRPSTPVNSERTTVLLRPLILARITVNLQIYPNRLLSVTGHYTHELIGTLSNT
jgi:hypothetical protein